jgi:nucleoside recognition membrane protein YjiH
VKHLDSLKLLQAVLAALWSFFAAMFIAVVANASHETTNFVLAFLVVSSLLLYGGLHLMSWIDDKLGKE